MDSKNCSQRVNMTVSQSSTYLLNSGVPMTRKEDVHKEAVISYASVETHTQYLSSCLSLIQSCRICCDSGSRKFCKATQHFEIWPAEAVVRQLIKQTDNYSHLPGRKPAKTHLLLVKWLNTSKLWWTTRQIYGLEIHRTHFSWTTFYKANSIGHQKNRRSTTDAITLRNWIQNTGVEQQMCNFTPYESVMGIITNNHLL